MILFLKRLSYALHDVISRKEMKTMRIDSYLDSSIFRRFTKFDILKRRKMWRSPVTFASIMCFCSIICFAMHRVDGAVLLGSVLLLVGLGMPVLYFTTFFLSLSKQVKAENLTSPRLVYSLELTDKDDGITIENGKERATYHWKNAFQAYLDDGCIYLFMTQDRAFLLPYKKDQYRSVWKLIKKRMEGKCKDIRKNR